MKLLFSCLILFHCSICAFAQKEDKIYIDLMNPSSNIAYLKSLPLEKIDSMRKAFSKLRSGDIPLDGIEYMPRRLKKKMRNYLLDNVDYVLAAVKNPDRLASLQENIAANQLKIEALIEEIDYEADRRDIILGYKEQEYESKKERRMGKREMRDELRELKKMKKEQKIYRIR